MPIVLPELEPVVFRRRLEEALNLPLSRELGDRLFAHYAELRRWAARVALIGSGEAEVLFERHYAESLRALPLVGGSGRLLDLGTGAGFPGWLLAAALPRSRVWLVESRARKAAFLRAASDRAELSCRVVGARVSRRQPLASVLGSEASSAGGIELITVRAVRMTEDIWEGLVSALAPAARVLRWEGAEEVEAIPGCRRGRHVELGGRRKIQEWLVATGPETSRC